MASENSLEQNQGNNRRTSGGYSYANESTPLVGDDGGPTIGWSSLSPKLRSSIVICSGFVLAILLVLLVLGSILLARTSDSRHSGDACPLSKSVPKLAQPNAVWATTTTTNGTSSTTTSMAKLTGYIYVYDLGFLALNIDRMTVIETGGGDGLLSLVDNCVNLTVPLYTGNQSNTLQSIRWSAVGELKQTLLGPSGGEIVYDKCSYYIPSWSHSFPTKNRYSCAERQVVQCLKWGESGHLQPKAELVISSLEVELDGDANQIRKGHFSKAPYSLSCNE